ncbi:hypothetical protein AB1Y20_004498 [Prymnesium parvum]|uniref:TraB domain-containing protein n=1 Tax=Prymnesium parvum TaxID=97485 RepID=A0AB34IZ94_PRYPA
MLWPPHLLASAALHFSSPRPSFLAPLTSISSRYCVPTLTENGALPTCVGRVAREERELLVIGTVHTPSAQQLEEVKSTIRAVRPDAVVLELDQERLEILLRDARENYAAEFAASFQVAAMECGALVMLGDLKGRDFLPSLIRPQLPLADYRRVALAIRRAIRWLPDSPPSSMRPTDQLVNVGRVLLDDPSRLAPIVLSVAATIAAAATYNALVPPCASQSLTVALPPALLACQIAFFVRAWDILILSRDDALARSALKAFDICAGLQAGVLLRRRFSFSADLKECEDACAAALPSVEAAITGAERTLNLYEPRWIALMERLALENGGSLVGATFGCLLSASRLTAPMESTIEDSPDRMLVKGSSSISHGERFADVVVHRTACMVRVMSCERSSRLVTGAPRLRVRIVADYEFEVHPTSLTATDAGFLVGEALDPPIGDLSDASSIGPSRSCTGGAISQRITTDRTYI